jgi:hypothetical protein
MKRHRHIECASSARETLKVLIEFPVDGNTPCFPLHFTCVNHQLSCHEPAGEGTVHGVVYQNEIGYTGPKMFQNNVSQDATIKTFNMIS